MSLSNVRRFTEGFVTADLVRELHKITKIIKL